jgi:hypothetical protein
MQPLAAAFRFGEDGSSLRPTATPGNEFPYQSGSQETERIAVERSVRVELSLDAEKGRSGRGEI